MHKNEEERLNECERNENVKHNRKKEREREGEGEEG